MRFVLRPARTVTAGAAMALAMVFSVQQGEHGPLVVYKLAVPAPAAAPLYAIPERAPKILGTVAVPAAGWAVLPEAAPAVPQAATLLELLARPAAAGAALAGESGEVVTLEQVKDDLSWRRDTVEKLRLVPVAPRF